ncbi:Hypothetical protein CCH01_014810 [Clostridium chauvoei JF4335]|nr:Hypothetical protein CCH01_014810 [Clostridium chauvoei JF4335]
MIIAVGVIMALIDVTPYLEAYNKINKPKKKKKEDNK